MKELVFASGEQTYSLKGKCEVTFNPSDRAFTEQFYSALDSASKLQEEYGEKAKNLSDPIGVFDLARERDAKIGEVIDGLFRAPVCEEVFGDMSPCAYADGFPVWLNLMLSVADEIEDNANDIVKQADPRIAKYKAKYAKYAKGYHK